MKFRRLLLAAIVLGGILLLALGIAGVFSPDEPMAPASRTELEMAGDLPPEGEPGQPVIEDYRVEGEDWVLTGKRAQIGSEGKVELVAPVLQGARETSRGPESVHVRAKKGVYTTEKAKDADDADSEELNRRVEMSGAVVIEFKGQQEAGLETEKIEIFLDKGIVRSEDLVTIHASTEEGDQEMSGVGFDMNRDERIVRILRDVHIEIAGAAAVLPAGPQPEDNLSSTEVITIDADGPAVLDGFKRSFTIENQVTLNQGESELNADRLLVFLAAEGKELEGEEEDADGVMQGVNIDRLEAIGHVSFKGLDATGRCESLLHVPDEEVILKGAPDAPAVLRQEPNEIQADRIEMDLVDGGVFVPVGGKVDFAMPAEKDASPKEVEVTWAKSMSFYDERGEAVCRGDVVFSYDNGAVKMGSDSLTVRFDKESKQLKECHGECYGESRVHLEGQVDSLGGTESDDSAKRDEPVDAWSREIRYDPETESLVLRGETELTQGARFLSGDYVALNVRKGTVQVTGAGSLTMETTKAESEGTLEAEWTGDMYFERETGEAEFNRDVVLTYGRTCLEGDHVTASIDEDQENPLRKLHATGEVELRDTGETDSVEPDSVERVLTCKDLTMEPNKDDASLQDVTAEGSVVVTEYDPKNKTSRRLEADTATSVIATDDIAADDAMKHLHAKDHVVFVQDGNRGEGDEFDWDVEEGSGVLTGAPVTLKSGMNEVTGDQLNFDQDMKRFRMTSKTRVEATLVTTGKKKDMLGGWLGASPKKE